MPSPVAFLRNSLFAAATALTLVFAGCNDPEAFVVWSPDGRHALVRNGQETTLIDPAGNLLGKPFAAPGEKSSVEAEAWMPDSRRVLAIRAVKAQGWSEFAPLLGPERAPAVIRAADELLAMIRDYRGDWSKFGEDNPKLERWRTQLDFAATYSLGRHVGLSGFDASMMAFVYLRERQPENVAPLKEFIEPDDAQFTIYELFIRNVLPGDAPAEQVLARSADVISWAVPSPDGHAIAFVRNEPGRPVLYVVSVESSGEPVAVDEGATQAAWTPEGQTLVYQKTTVPFSAVEEQAQLGTLTRRQVRDATDAFLAKLPDAEDLAGILFASGQNRVACLPDGRFLFATAEVTLPATETAHEISLFAYRPGAIPAIERVVPEAARKSLPSRVDRFAVSPDGRRVALPGSSGEVALLSLETGAVTALQGPIADYRDSSKSENSPSEPAPSWRTADELCYLVAPGEAGAGPRRGEVVLRPLGGTPRLLSPAWPDALTDRFLPRPKR